MVRILLESIYETLFWGVFHSHTGARVFGVHGMQGSTCSLRNKCFSSLVSFLLVLLMSEKELWKNNTNRSYLQRKPEVESKKNPLFLTIKKATQNNTI